MKDQCGHKTHIWCKVAVSFGIANAVGMLILGLLGAFCGYGVAMISVISSIYPGYAPTIVGSFIGAFWGFLDILLFFLIAGLVYRGLSCCCCNKCNCPSTCECRNQGGCCANNNEKNVNS